MFGCYLCETSWQACPRVVVYGFRISFHSYQAACETGRTGVICISQTRMLRPRGDFLIPAQCLLHTHIWDPGHVLCRETKCTAGYHSDGQGQCPAEQNDFSKLPLPSQSPSTGSMWFHGDGYGGLTCPEPHLLPASHSPVPLGLPYRAVYSKGFESD